MTDLNNPDDTSKFICSNYILNGDGFLGHSYFLCVQKGIYIRIHKNFTRVCTLDTFGSTGTDDN